MEALSTRLPCACAGCLAVALATIALPQAKARSAEVDEAYARAVARVFATGKLGAQLTRWCNGRVPAGQAAHDTAHRAWRTAYGFDDVDARLAALAGTHSEKLAASVDESSLHARLDKQFKDPQVTCRDLEKTLHAVFDPRKIDAAAYKLVTGAALGDGKARSDSVTSGAVPRPPDTSGARGEWDLLDPQHVEKTLQPAGSQAPLALGGKLATGGYRCVQVRSYGASAGTEYRYMLTLYDDQGLRIDGVVMTSASLTQPTAGRAYVGKYAYKMHGGELSANEWDYANRDLKNYAMFQGNYKPVDGKKVEVIAFRHVLDARGKSFLYGSKQYGSHTSTTACAHAGEPARDSPVVEAKAKQVASEAVRYKHRTKPGAGLKLGDIEGYLHTSELRTNVGGGTRVDERSELLLNDGWGCGARSYSPHDFDAETSRRDEPQRWFRWKRDGGGIATSRDGKNWKKSHGRLAGPIAAKSLVGSFEVMNAYGVSPSSTATFKTRTWVFDRDRRFAFFSSSRAGLYDSSGKSEGTYAVEGYTLELKYKDGSTHRAFAYVWGKDDTELVIDGVTYTRQR